jgi:hypothetical protein
MAKSRPSYLKKEKEKQKQQQRREKAERRDARKSSQQKGRPLEEMLVYLDENGNLTSTPPSKRS